MSRWSRRDDVPRGDDYDRRWREMEAAGRDPHGEVALVMSLLEGLEHPRVLDAGCGTGRVAIELARRGIDVVGVDLDEGMLTTARSKAPTIEWHQRDLAGLDLRDASGARQLFDTVVLAGNVMIFVEPGSEAAVVAAMSAHLGAGGLLVAGFQLQPGFGMEDYERCCRAAGLTLEHRWGTWDREPFDRGDYAVSVHRREWDR